MDDPAATVTTYAGPTRSVPSVDHPLLVDASGEVLHPGTSVGRYVVAEHVGAGGMGRVYAAYDPELDRKVALKLLRTERNDELGRHRLVGEARALAKLAHPHVVAVHDVGMVDEQVFVAMEYVAGTTLRHELAQRPHGWREGLELLLPVAEGLVAIHAAGLVHRDLKPENVMLGDDGRVRVMDFGLARAPRPGDPSEDTTGRIALAAPEPEALTRTGARLGTPPYMAPEQWLGLPADARTDQFAFCVTLWEALYGERPFVGGTIVALEQAITNGVVTSPARAAEVPRWLRRVLERGLAVDPDRRYASMEGLVDAIARARRGARLRWGAAGLGVVGAALVAVVLGRPPGPATTPAAAPALRGPRLRLEINEARVSEVQAAAGSLAPCEPDQVCVHGHWTVPVCMTDGGAVPTDGTSCAPGGGARECSAHEACMITEEADGDAGHCVRACSVIDDRPECAPGCYNRLCSGTFELCAREQGKCEPVPCSTNADCVALGACDYPTYGNRLFRCNVEVGYCERVRT
jgi:predicted Ser/Thr protein kinase